MSVRSMRKMILGMVMVLFLSVFAYPSTSRADFTFNVKNGFKKTVTYTSTDKKEGYYFSISKIPYSAKKVKVSLSKKSVGRVKSYGGGDFVFYPKKTGTTKVTVTAVVKGKKVNCRGTIQVVKFKKPFKSLKVDGKNYVGKVKSSAGNFIGIKTDKSKVNVGFSLNSEWKVSKITIDGKKMKTRRSYTLKKGKYMEIIVQNKKSKVEVAVGIYTE